MSVLLLLASLAARVEGQSFIVGAAGTASTTNQLIQFSTDGEVLLATPLDYLYDNAAYDSAHRLVYFCGIGDESSFIVSYHADTLKLVRPAISIPNKALLDLQFDRVTDTLLALTLDARDGFVVVSINISTGAVVTLAVLPEAVTSVSENSEAFDDVAGVYWVAALYQTGPSGWLPVFTRTGKVGPLVQVSVWVQNTVWNPLRESLCGTWTDGSSIACTNISSAETTVFSPALNFSTQGFRLLGASAFDKTTQRYFSVFETHKPLVSWIRAGLSNLTSFAANIEKYFVSSMVFVPAT